MKQEKKDKFLRFLHNSAILVFIGIISFFVYIAVREGIFSSSDNLKVFIESAGVWAPVVFVLLQTLTVLIIVLPSGVGYGVGTVLFGPWLSLLLNAIATILGSLVIYGCVKLWGNKFLEAFVSEKNLHKYREFLNNEKHYKRFRRLFAIMLLLPFAPDNVLCYIAGTTKMTFKEYAIMIALFKPWQLFLFCFGVDSILSIFPW